MDGLDLNIEYLILIWFDVFLKHLRKLDIKDKDKQKASIFKTKKDSKSLKQIIMNNLTNFRIRKGEENRWTLLDLQDDKSLEAFIRYYVQERFCRKVLKAYRKCNDLLYTST